MLEVERHLLHGPAKRGEDNIQIIDNDGDPGLVYRKEVVEIPKQPACGLNFSEDRRDLVIEFQVEDCPDS